MNGKFAVPIVMMLEGVIVWVAFAINLSLVAANGPLILAWQNIVPPVAVVLGPPLVFLTSIALLSGFVLLLLSPLGTWAAWPFARVTEWSRSSPSRSRRSFRPRPAAASGCPPRKCACAPCSGT